MESNDNGHDSTSSWTNFQTFVEALNTKINATNQQQHLPDLKHQLDNARLLLTEGVQWWVSYDIRRAQEMIVHLETALDATTARLKPKANFKFKRRRARTAPTIASAEATRGVARSGGHDGMRGEALVFDGTDLEQGGAGVHLRHGEIAGKDVSLKDLSARRVFLLDVVGALRGVNLKDCDIITGPVTGSVHITRCSGCTFHLVARQLRIHEALDCSFRLRIVSGPIMEHSRSLKFGVYDVSYTELQSQLEATAFSSENRWDEVKDFNWLHAEQSPNWRLLSEEECRSNVDIPDK